MITDDERKRWRQLFSKATAGPWTVQLHPFTNTIAISAAAGFEPVVGERVNLRLEDADLIAEARLGWPRTLDAVGILHVQLAAAELELDTRLTEQAHAHGKAVAEAAIKIAQLQSQCDAYAKQVAKLRELEQDVAGMRTRFVDAQALANAAVRWQSDRYSPNLLAAIDAYKEQTK